MQKRREKIDEPCCRDCGRWEPVGVGPGQNEDLAEPRTRLWGICHAADLYAESMPAEKSDGSPLSQCMNPVPTVLKTVPYSSCALFQRGSWEEVIQQYQHLASPSSS